MKLKQTSEQKFLLAILKQSIRDYIRLDPDSDTVSAEYNIDEGTDFRTAEAFLFEEMPLEYGDLNLTLDDVCLMLDVDQQRIKKRINRSFIEY